MNNPQDRGGNTTESLILLREMMTYWERKRVLYNIILMITVSIVWGRDIFLAKYSELFGLAIVLLVLGGIANALYCLAYPVDYLLQLTQVRQQWKATRWILFAMGQVIACSLAIWIMLRQGMA